MASTKWLMFYELSPDGLQKARENFPAHRARLQSFQARGLLLAAGPLQEPMDAALGVFTTREAAEEFVKDDPFVTSGAVAKWSVRAWSEAFWRAE
jgi:hypothetical protein